MTEQDLNWSGKVPETIVKAKLHDTPEDMQRSVNSLYDHAIINGLTLVLFDMLHSKPVDWYFQYFTHYLPVLCTAWRRSTTCWLSTILEINILAMIMQDVKMCQTFVVIQHYIIYFNWHSLRVVLRCNMLYPLLFCHYNRFVSRSFSMAFDHVSAFRCGSFWLLFS